MDFGPAAEELREQLIAWRRDFHRHPELGFEERRTAGVIQAELEALGLVVRTGIAETGVVGVLAGARPGPTVLLRVDMDALPVLEESSSDYRSENAGVMHACGHDGHLAMGLGVARLFAARRASLAGRLVLVFQPAEEGLGGAQRMLEEGVWEDQPPDYILGIHLWNQKPVGWIALTPGPMMAAADLLDIDIHGQGGHGGLPQSTRDPVVAAAMIITALQSIVARNVDPLQSAVISITQVTAGEAYNVIPATAQLKGTIRTFDRVVRAYVLERIGELATSVGSALGCQVQVRSTCLTPAVVNDPALTARLQQLVVRRFPQLQVLTDLRTTVSEDAAFFLDYAPGCYVLLGSSSPERGLTADHHNQRFDFDEEALVTGTSFLAAAIDHLLEDG